MRGAVVLTGSCLRKALKLKKYVIEKNTSHRIYYITRYTATGHYSSFHFLLIRCISR